MDSLFAIGCGLGLRALVGIVSHNDPRVGGTLVGLWEGVVLYHFLQKMPTSFDPYVGFGIRLFVDFLFTESLPRLAIVVLWTGLGMVLADITPVVWYDAGLRRLWHRVRRDLSISIPVPLFAKNPSRVRFLSTTSRASSVASSARDSAASAATSVPQSTIPMIPPPRERPRGTRILPGSFPGDWTETETDRGSSVAGREAQDDAASDATELAARRLSVIMEDDYISDSALGPRVAYASTSSSDSDTENGDPADPSAAAPVDIPDEVSPAFVERAPSPTHNPIHLPPTPADSAVPAHFDHEVAPSLAETPLIPDQLDGDAGEGWEKVDADDGAAAQDRLETQTLGTQPPEDLLEAPIAETQTHIPPADNVFDVPIRDSRTPPPPFQEFLGDDSKSDRASIPASNRDSILSETTKTRLDEALRLRKQAAALRKRIVQLQKEREQALTDRKMTLALAKKVECDKVIEEEKRANERAVRRFWSVHNKGRAENKISLQDLQADEAVYKTEEALEQLLRPEDGSAEVRGGAQLEVDVGAGVKGTRLKERVMRAMSEHGLVVTEAHDRRKLIISLPNTDES